MPLPLPNLDDRRFDDLVLEARARIASHLPELTQIAPGDPLNAFVDLFAWLGETILYRANLIPERQRRVLLNLLQVPLRPARPARGLLRVDAPGRGPELPPLLGSGAEARGGGRTFTTLGELQPTPLELKVLIKQVVDDETLARMGYTKADLREQHRKSGADGIGLDPADEIDPFSPRVLDPGREPLGLDSSVDGAYYLALAVPKTLETQVDALRQALAGITLNVGLAPQDDRLGDLAEETRDRVLAWELLSEDPRGDILALPLEVLEDSSGGGRRLGVARLRLPRNALLFRSLEVDDPLFAGVGERPPELPVQTPAARVALWLRLSCPEDPYLPLGYLGVNAVEALDLAWRRNLLAGVGTGRPDQVLDLPDRDLDAESLVLEVEEGGAWVQWQRLEILSSPEGGGGGARRGFRLDAQAGRIHFGDGISAKRPPEGMRIRVSYGHGGGAAGNFPAGTLKELTGGSQGLTLRQELPTRGGLDGETLEQAELRIPEFLTHRNRAVTRDDFRRLALSNPLSPVARAEVVMGLLPGASLAALRRNVPGVVSVFVLPPGPPILGQTPKPSQGLLKDCFSYLVERVLVGTELYVLSPAYLPIAVSVRVDVRDPATESQTLAAVRQALVAFLWPLAPGGLEGTGWPMGGTLRPNEIEVQVARVPGVRAVNRLALFVREGDGWIRLPEGSQKTLEDYQLPEPMGVWVGSGGGEPELPLGLSPAGAATKRRVPAPAIPDLC